MKSITKLRTLSVNAINLSKIGGLVAVKSGKALLGMMKFIYPTIGLTLTSARFRALVVLMRRISVIRRSQGVKGLCIWLKANAVVLQQSLGGYRIKDTTPLGVRVSRTKQGLPRCIPRIHRWELLSNPVLIRFYLTVFNLYRNLEFKGKMTLNALAKTIVSPSTATHVYDTDILVFIPIFVRKLEKYIGMNQEKFYRFWKDKAFKAEPFPILKSSPLTQPVSALEEFYGKDWVKNPVAFYETPVVSSHPEVAYAAAWALGTEGVVFKAMAYFLEYSFTLQDLFQRFLEIPRISTSKRIERDRKSLGKLSLKQEAAGKVRVFAMVDAWTQWVLAPVHDVIFNHILPRLPEDGTMDQLAPLHRLMGMKPSCLYSLDLTAATDRVPLWLQQRLIAAFTNERFARNWANLLVGRGYNLSFENSVTGEREEDHILRYGVGQPMGALSSWAMLALVHHFIIQYAAHRVGHSRKEWFTQYAVLGDDMVVGNLDVARSYLRVMKSLGVKVGLHKSLLSQSGSALEFAKRTFYRGVDVSPVSLKEWVAATRSPAALAQFAKTFKLGLPALSKALGFGYKVLGGLHKPFRDLNSRMKFLVLALNAPTTVEEVKTFFMIGAPRHLKSLNETREVIEYFVKLATMQMERDVKSALQACKQAPQSQKDLVEILSDGIDDLQDAKDPEVQGLETIDKTVTLFLKASQGPSLAKAKAALDRLQVWIWRLKGSITETDFATAYIQVLSLLRELSSLPLSNMKFERFYSDTVFGIKDTTHTRMWKLMSRYLHKASRLPESGNVKTSETVSPDKTGGPAKTAGSL